MTEKRDDVRPRASVEVPCATCPPADENGEFGPWCFWVDPLDPRLPDGPFICPTCSGMDLPKAKGD